MRKSLYEKLKSNQIYYLMEINKIASLIYGDYNLSTHVYFSNSFKKSAFNVYYEDFDMAMCDIFECDSKYQINKEQPFLSIIRSALFRSDNLTLDSFLNYLEFFKTLLDCESGYHNSDVEQIEKIVEFDCEKLGYTFVLEDNYYYYRVRIVNPLAESIAINTKQSTRDKIYDYLMIRNGKVEEKRKCLKSLADDIEIICNEYNNIDEYKKLKQFIQCVRHTKDKPKKEFPFYYTNEEEWLDKIFEMVIGIISFTETKKIVKEIKSLETNNPND